MASLRPSRFPPCLGRRRPAGIAAVLGLWAVLLAVGCNETGVSLVVHANVKIPDQLDAYCLQLAAGGEVDFARRYPLSGEDAGTPRTLSVRPGEQHYDTFDVLLRGERRGREISFQRKRLAFTTGDVPEAHFSVPYCTVPPGRGTFEFKNWLTQMPAVVAAMPVSFAPGQMLTVASVSCGNGRCDAGESPQTCPVDCDPNPKKAVQRFAQREAGKPVERREDGLPQDVTEPATRILSADIDNDCDLDLIVLYPSGPRVWRQDNGTFTEVPNAIMVGGNFTAGAVADLDGNGFVDVVLAGQDSVKLLLNDGNNPGRFADRSSQLPAGLGGADAVAIGFLNGDPYPEIVLARGASKSSVNGLLAPQPDAASPGQLKYQLQPLDGLGDRSSSVAVADMNGDGLQDLVFGNVVGDSMIYLNDPKNIGTLGKHADGAKAIPGARDEKILDILAVDLTGACHIDVVLLRELGTRVFINDGNANLKEPVAPNSTTGAGRAAVVDVDGDGLLDLVLGGTTTRALWMRQQ
jgi:hypothetical protein